MSKRVMNRRMSGRYATDARRGLAIRRRDRDADRAFVYAVRTTGVYCRPSCPSRQPRMKNVRYFDDAPSARLAGFRPCRRCRPDDALSPGRLDAAVVRACRTIESSPRALTLAELSTQAGVSPWHFQRVFKRRVGLSPKQYTLAQRTRRLRVSLRTSNSVTSALGRAGFASPSRAYDTSARELGMAPSRYRRGAEGVRISSILVRSPVGLMLVAATSKGVCSVALGDDPARLRSELRLEFPKAIHIEGGRDVQRWARRIVRQVQSPDARTSLPLDIHGTAFQRRVWRALREIPPGQTRTYQAIAARVGRPAASRAVGAACARNPVAIAVPCHRVVRSDGELGDYRWGADRKKRLVELERRACEGRLQR